MGGGASKVSNVAPKDVPVMRPAHAAGKFLLQTEVNAVAGGGGTYLSMAADGHVCGATTENDPELWRLAYVEGPCQQGKVPDKHDVFRVLNTGRKRVLTASDGGGGMVLGSNPEGGSTDTAAAAAAELFYLSSALAKSGCYLMRPQAAPTMCLRHGNDGKVELVVAAAAAAAAAGAGTGVAGDDVQWKLQPSF
jgi:hypothetical protein